MALKLRLQFSLNAARGRQVKRGVGHLSVKLNVPRNQMLISAFGKDRRKK